MTAEVDLLVIGSSATVRRCFAAAFAARALRCREAQDALDALAQLRLGVSLRQVVCLGPKAASDARSVRTSLAREGLTELPVLAVSDKAEAAPNIAIAPMAEIVEAVASALPGSPVTAVNRDEALVAQHMDAMRELNKAQALFLDVVERVENDDLPGPMMPQLLKRLRTTLRDPDLSLLDLAEFIKPHQTLAARVMALANSSLYCRGAPATSLRQALSRIGLEQTGRLLQAVATLEYEVGSDPHLRGLIRRLLKASYATALATERLAEDCLHPQPADAYANGLFHNIGSTFLVYTFALLLERAAVKPISAPALEAIAFAQRAPMNRLLVRALELPESLTQLDGGAVAPAGSIERLVAQGAWVAERMLASGSDSLRELELDADAQLLGVPASAIKLINKSLPGFSESLAAFR
jgi:HD-like signal output (HDOD) protein